MMMVHMPSSTEARCQRAIKEIQATKRQTIVGVLHTVLTWCNKVEALCDGANDTGDLLYCCSTCGTACAVAAGSWHLNAQS